MKKPENTQNSERDSASTPKSLRVLFTSFFMISAFTFGGGYVIVPLQKRRFCDELGWISEEEILNLTAIAQSAPGPVALNGAVLTGHHLFGIKGAVLGALGTVLPPLIILSIISLFYAAFSQNIFIRCLLKGMQAGVAALIISACWDMGRQMMKSRSVFQACVFLAAALLLIFTSLNIVVILLLAAAAGLAFSYLKKTDKEV